MIQVFIDRFMAAQETLRAQYKAAHPDSYGAIVKDVVKIIAVGDNGYGGTPDPERIHEINDGDYQGTLLFVIAADNYQPSTYWSVFVDYGSCSGCDTLEALRTYSSEPPTDKQADGYVTLALHIVQGLKLIGEPS